MKIRAISNIVPLILLLCLLASPSRSQSFSLDTSSVASGSSYSYSFTLNYDQAGTAQTLTAPMYDWSFSLDPALAAPNQVLLPTGWKDSYDPTSGQFDFYTEGPNGFGSGDFGPNVIQPGQSLSGFGLTTFAAPGQSIAFATDEQFNQDATLATLPTTAPVPEAATFATFGILLFLGGLLALRRQRVKQD